MNYQTHQESKLINLSSEYANQNYNSTFLSNLSFNTPGLVISNPLISKIEISVLHSEIPVSFYTINYSNSFFKYKLGTGSILTKQIPVGNYNANTLITALKTLINDVNFTITINKITGVLIFFYNQTFTIYTDNTYSIAKILGFNLNTSYVSAETPLYTLTALYPLNLLGIKKINISSQTLITNNFTSGIGTTSLITSISVDQPPFGLIVYQNTGSTKFTLSKTDIHKIDLQLFDEDFNYINFNNINWSILFCLHLTYRMPIPQISKQINDKLQPSEPDNPKINDLNFLNS
jgi:hypothetical protein